MRSQISAAFTILSYILSASASLSSATAEETSIIVFAATSLKNSLDEISSAWTLKFGAQIKISYAASNALAKQIEEGAPADLFISADLDWMNYLEDKNLVETGARINLLGNSIVLIASKDWNRDNIRIVPNFPLVELLGDGRLALANVASVPAGKYAKAALEKLGVWSSVSNRLAEAENVRAALAFVARGEAPLGIGYITDAMTEPSLKIIGTFPPDSHPPIVYPAAIIVGSKNPRAREFLRYLSGSEAKLIFEKNGFSPLTGKSLS
jgi:molybdate transport system substrate-binding protein